MSNPARYAIYLAPPPDSDLWRFGSRVIGRDAYTNETVPGFATPGHDGETWRARTSDPRRYGFHATMKAPFRLAEGATSADLEARLDAFSRFMAPFDAGDLRVSKLPAGSGRAFVALTLKAPSAELARLEAMLVREFDDLRAPMTPAERERRSPARLSPRQQDYLDAWGYPYVLEEFRLHFTLTNALEGAEEAIVELSGAFAAEVKARPLRVDALAIFTQKNPESDFQILRRVPFGGP